MLMRTRAVDFAHVEPAHEAIDARLHNWARWANGRSGPRCSPMFRLYRSSEARTIDATPGAAPVDTLDAQRIQKAVTHLPGRHRLALSWCYITRTSARKAAQTVGESLEGLAQLIRDARQMLINRGA
jgi:DNA-directed RNA polymerase specialized sigma24 family protein